MTVLQLQKDIPRTRLMSPASLVLGTTQAPKLRYLPRRKASSLHRDPNVVRDSAVERIEKLSMFRLLSNKAVLLTLI